MSTFLVTVLVVAMSIAAAVTLALNDPDQPATLRDRKRRDPRPPRTRARRPLPPPAGEEPPVRRAPPLVPAAAGGGARPAAAATTAAATATAAPTSAEIAGLTDGWAPARPTSPWLRIRSGFVLTILLAIVGALVAAGLAGLIVLVALAVRSAVG